MKLSAHSFCLQTSNRLLFLVFNMLSGRSLRFSWICLLMFSTAFCFPATKGDYRYPYRWNSGPAAGSNSQPQGPHRPLASLQQEAGSAAGNQSPSSAGAPSAGSSPSYKPNGFLLTSGSSANKPAKAPEVSPQSSRYDQVPAGTRPVHQAPPALYSGGAAVSSVSEPGSGSSGAVAPASYGVGSSYYSSSSGPGLSWDEQPAEGAGDSFPDLSVWMASRNFPDFSVWESAQGVSQGAPEGAGGMPPLPPSSYIIQSRNNFMRARELVSHSLYSPEYADPVVYAPQDAAAASKSPAAPGSKGGKKV